MVIKYPVNVIVSWLLVMSLLAVVGTWRAWHNQTPRAEASSIATCESPDTTYDYSHFTKKVKKMFTTLPGGTDLWRSWGAAEREAFMGKLWAIAHQVEPYEGDG
jgi:hypothetical protein